MPASYLPHEPDQDFLLSSSLRKRLPEGHLACFIGDTVEALDLTTFMPARPRAPFISRPQQISPYPRHDGCRVKPGMTTYILPPRLWEVAVLEL